MPGVRRYRPAMSTVQEIKAAVEHLAPEERAELARWLAEGPRPKPQADDAAHQEWVRNFEALRATHSFKVGKITWTRDELHER